ncbi:MAG: V-type ATP synthase subunit F [Candidatus Paceibacterota bacterium]
MSTQYKIAVVGPQDLVSGFRALGVDVFDAEKGETALEAIKKIKRMTSREQTGTNDEARYAAVFVIDSLVNDIPEDEYLKATEGALPSVITIPGLNADKEAGTRKLRQLTEKAIGSDILSND